MARPQVRQDPPVRTGDKAGGEFCPEHGLYRPAYEALETRRKATAPKVSAPRAWRLLEHAERIRRTCPQCRTVVPPVGRWAARLRCTLQAAATDPFAPRCNFCQALLPADDPTSDRHRCGR